MLLVVTLVSGRPPILYCCMFGGLVCLEICLLLFGVILFASAQSLAVKMYADVSTKPTEQLFVS